MAKDKDVAGIAPDMSAAEAADDTTATAVDIVESVTPETVDIAGEEVTSEVSVPEVEPAPVEVPEPLEVSEPVTVDVVVAEAAQEPEPVAAEEPQPVSETVPVTPETGSEVVEAAEPVAEVPEVAAETTATEEASGLDGDTAAAAEGPPEDQGPSQIAIRAERPAITAPKDIGDIPDDLSADDFAAAVERTVFEFTEGDIVAGTVVRVDPDEVLVDIGYKSEGVIPNNELSIRNNANPNDVVTVGEEIEALVLQKEDENGRLVLSKKRAQYERAWGRIERVMNEGGTVTGHVIEVVKGGLIVDIGLRGFLPASLVDLRRVRDLHPYIGETIEAKVIELDKNRNNVVLSRRAHLEEAQAEQRQAFLSGLESGDVRPGTVSSVVNFGAFVDLGGMDGLVHVSELSWQHVSHPSEVVSVGDKVDVKVLEVDRDRERISLSIRQTREDPWEEFARAHSVGSVVEGKVTKTVPFGAFVSIGEGVEGLVHVSEIAMHHVESPELELSIDQPVNVKVTEIDAERRRVSLSIKQAMPEWEQRSQQATPERAAPRQQQRAPVRQEFQREEEATPEPAFNADASLEAILQELKEKGIGRK